MDQDPVVTHLVALVGKDSIWDPKTGLPKKRKNPHDVWLISIPESDIHPLEPRDVTEEELRTRIDHGEKVFFVTAGEYGEEYGTVRIEGERLVFRNYQEDR